MAACARDCAKDGFLIPDAGEFILFVYVRAVKKTAGKILLVRSQCCWEIGQFLEQRTCMSITRVSVMWFIRRINDVSVVAVLNRDGWFRTAGGVESFN